MINYPCPNLNQTSAIWSVVPEAGIIGRDRWLHQTLSGGYNYWTFHLIMLLAQPSPYLEDTQLLTATLSNRKLCLTQPLTDSSHIYAKQLSIHPFDPERAEIHVTETLASLTLHSATPTRTTLMSMLVYKSQNVLKIVFQIDIYFIEASRSSLRLELHVTIV